MFQTYDEALSWIHSRLRLGMKPGLKRMEWMMEKLDHPERRIKAIHVGGTNGKGSTVSFLRSILQEAGYKIGTFTSPYIEQFNERISINGMPIGDDELVQLANVIKPLSDELEETGLGGPTEFEVITAMALYYFAFVEPVDAAIFEVGLGGRFDSTNIIHPILSIITNVGTDHTNILGDSPADIAFEKGGIIKNGVGLIKGIKNEDAKKVIVHIAKERKAPVYAIGVEFEAENHQSLPKGESFSFRSLFHSFEGLEISLLGKHQVDNASLAVMAALYLKNFYSFLIDPEHVRNGLKKVYWPGRFEMASESPIVILDGAHNEDGVKSLVEELERRYKGKKITVIFAALKDKNYTNMIHDLDGIADQIAFVSFDFPRAAAAKELYEASSSANKSYSDNWKQEVERKIKQLAEKDILVITGSLYFISEVKQVVPEFLA